MELVLEDLEDLLLVGRLLLPVKVITGGSTAAGGTYTKSKQVALCCTVLYCDAVHFVCTNVTMMILLYLSQLGKKTVYFFLLAGVEGLNLTHVPGSIQRGYY